MNVPNGYVVFYNSVRIIVEGEYLGNKNRSSCQVTSDWGHEATTIKKDTIAACPWMDFFFCQLQWVSTPKFDIVTWEFLTFNMRHGHLVTQL